MIDSHPWEFGTDDERWDAYLVEPGSRTLRNRLGLHDAAALEKAENDLLEIRLAELRENPSLIRRSFDLNHLQSLHRYLFQDVYEWAGDLRSVGLGRGDGESFAPPPLISRVVWFATSRIAQSANLRDIPDSDLPHHLAELYDYLNFAHPFREGNGRTQREFFAQLLAESGRGMSWNRVGMSELHSACHIARNQFDLEPLKEVLRSALFIER
ncbi:Fic/DOC family protein [Humidisolicoccus flavus]|uniref:Fic/DOC family protein n=1 Tax=Humidisolicoccus flavus TaxID=3111414 RepID=UPI00324E40FF